MPTLLPSPTLRLLVQLRIHLPAQQRQKLALLLPAAASVAGLDLLLILALAQLVGRLAVGGGQPIQQLVILVLSLGWCLALCRSLLRTAQYQLAASMTRTLTDQVLARLLAQPYGFHLCHDRSELSAQLLHQLPELGPQVVIPGVQAIANLSTIVLLSFGLLVMAGPASLVVLLLMLLAYALLAQVVKGPLRRWQGEKLKLQVQSQALVADALSTVRSMLLQGGQQRLEDRHAGLSGRIALLEGRSAVLPELPRQLVEPVGLTLLLLLLLLPAVRSNGPHSLPWLALVTVGMIRLAQPLQELWRGVNVLQGAQPLLEGSLRLLALPLQVSVRNKPITLPVGRGPTVGLRNVWFRYPDGQVPDDCGVRPAEPFLGRPHREVPRPGATDRKGVADADAEPEGWLLRGLDLDLAPGEMVGLVGGSGEGKSTVASLLLGLLLPQKGELRVEGQPVGLDTITSWQRQCSEVSQPVRLLRGSVAENLIGWGEDPGEGELWRVLWLARLEEQVSVLPQGLRTPVGEDGLRLSGGQVQRLALARALLRRPRFLVLDEATSGLDLRTERAVLAALEAIGPKTTILVIAHRPSTMARCRRLLLLEDGQIRDQGGYEQLLRESASFRRLLANGGSEATARPG